MSHVKLCKLHEAFMNKSKCFKYENKRMIYLIFFFRIFFIRIIKMNFYVASNVLKHLFSLTTHFFSPEKA